MGIRGVEFRVYPTVRFVRYEELAIQIIRRFVTCRREVHVGWLNMYFL